MSGDAGMDRARDRNGRTRRSRLGGCAAVGVTMHAISGTLLNA